MAAWVPHPVYLGSFLLFTWPSELSALGPLTCEAAVLDSVCCPPSCPWLPSPSEWQVCCLVTISQAQVWLVHFPAPPSSEPGIWTCLLWEVWGFNGIDLTPINSSCWRHRMIQLSGCRAGCFSGLKYFVGISPSPTKI